MREGLFKIPAAVEAIEEGLLPVVSAMKEAGIPHKICYKVRLALDELLTNVVYYAYDGKPGDIEIHFEISELPHSITITIADEGKPFDPLQSEDPNLPSSAQERKVGGLGIFIVKSTMDHIQYRRENNRNILTIRKDVLGEGQ